MAIHMYTNTDSICTPALGAPRAHGAPGVFEALGSLGASEPPRAFGAPGALEARGALGALEPFEASEAPEVPIDLGARDDRRARSARDACTAWTLTAGWLFGAR